MATQSPKKNAELGKLNFDECKSLTESSYHIKKKHAEPWLLQLKHCKPTWKSFWTILDKNAKELVVVVVVLIGQRKPFVKVGVISRFAFNPPGTASERVCCVTGTENTSSPGFTSCK